MPTTPDRAELLRRAHAKTMGEKWAAAWADIDQATAEMSDLFYEIGGGGSHITYTASAIKNRFWGDARQQLFDARLRPQGGGET